MVAESWRAEVERLMTQVPSVCVATLQEHGDEVLDVAFSNDGALFSTCSRDAHVIVRCIYTAI